MKKLKDTLLIYTETDFASFVPKSILRLSETERLTTEFAFWFCHSVEQDLSNVLKVSSEAVRAEFGEWTKEISDFIKEKHKVKLDKADPAHPDYNSSEITFGDRIFFVEKMRGNGAHVSFLWKVKKIRDDLSHGRISELSYEGKNLVDIEVKRKMIMDYITLTTSIENEPIGGLSGNNIYPRG